VGRQATEEKSNKLTIFWPFSFISEKGLFFINLQQKEVDYEWRSIQVLEKHEDRLACRVR
jgi:hypothetical protein